jgi:hypothetical protein
MPNSQSYEFFAPTVPTLDTSGITVGGQVSASGMIAGGQAIAAGIAKMGEEFKQQQGEESVVKAMEEVGKESNWETQNIDPSADDPTLVGPNGEPLDQIGRRALIADRMKAMGYPDAIAMQKAVQATTPIPTRILKREALDKVRGLKARAIALGGRAGMGTEDVKKALDLATVQGYDTPGDAQRAMREQYIGIVSPPAAELTALQATLSGRERALDRDATVRMKLMDAAQMREELRTRAGLGREDAKIQNDYAKERMQLDADLREAQREGDWAREARLLNLQDHYATRRIQLEAQLDKETRLEVERTRGDLAQELAEIKGAGGNFTAAEQQAAEEFSLNVEGSALEKGAAFMPVPLRAVAPLVGAGGLGDYVKSVGADIKPGDRLIQLGADPGANLSSLSVRIGADGEPQIIDAGGKTGLTALQLRQLELSMFGSPSARAAVVVQQVYRSSMKRENDVSTLLSINERARALGGIGIVDRARMMLQQVAASGGPKSGSGAGPAPVGSLDNVPFETLPEKR